MAVELDDWRILNVYTPVKKEDRPQFFHDLEPWRTQHQSIIMGGDFNCVLRPHRDQISGRLPSKAPCERILLQKILDRQDMTDAINTWIMKMKLQIRSVTSRDGVTSRLNKFYVKGEPFKAAQGLYVMDVAHDSDHQEVRLELSTGKNEIYSSFEGVLPNTKWTTEKSSRRNRRRSASTTRSLWREYDQVEHWDELIDSIQHLLQHVRRADRKQTESTTENYKQRLTYHELQGKR